MGGGQQDSKQEAGGGGKDGKRKEKMEAATEWNANVHIEAVLTLVLDVCGHHVDAVGEPHRQHHVRQAALHDALRAHRGKRRSPVGAAAYGTPRNCTTGPRISLLSSFLTPRSLPYTVVTTGSFSSSFWADTAVADACSSSISPSHTREDTHRPLLEEPSRLTYPIILLPLLSVRNVSWDAAGSQSSGNTVGEKTECARLPGRSMEKRWVGVKPAFLATTLAQQEMDPFRTDSQARTGLSMELLPDSSHIFKGLHDHKASLPSSRPINTAWVSSSVVLALAPSGERWSREELWRSSGGALEELWRSGGPAVV
ncbi:hypothetical protein EYF80_011837 [Liparis tanakae]|uniref:Uncharacterized protein n=1 Tax=Liparis tanakae TaxID=230148 RepID=A0A4Z2IKB2_9TELE|nr:hypothetical protein EYF80_011837 [Liparis tanakae]